MECIGPEHPRLKALILCKKSSQLFPTYRSKNYCENHCDVRKLDEEKDDD